MSQVTFFSLRPAVKNQICFVTLNPYKLTFFFSWLKSQLVELELDLTDVDPLSRDSNCRNL